MPPKSAKQAKGNKSSPDGATADMKSWEAGLTKAPFEEETWRACVSLVVGRGPEDEELIQALALAAKQPLRKLFSSLTWQDTLAKIHELGNPKVRKPAGVPAFSEVTESAKALLDAGEEIPCDLMAKILKFQLLQVKANDQQRREAEQAGLQSSNKGKGGTVPDKKRKSPTTSVEHLKERKTKLKSRDEVDPPNFIDDEPEDGPQHYILVLGFYQPQLIGALDTIGVHVANVIKLCSEHILSNSEGQEEHTHEGSHRSPRASPAFDAETENQGGVELVRELDQFWAGLRPVLDSGPPASKLHDIIELSYNFPYLPAPFQTQDPEAELKLGSQIFEGVASLIYGILDWRRQHQHYLNNTKFISVPTVVMLDPQLVEVVSAPVSVTPRSKKKPVSSEKETKEPPPLSTNVDMRYYMNLLDLVPPEACSVPLILHCVLEQVVASTEQCSLPLCSVAEEPAPHSAAGSDHQLLRLMLNSFLPLVHTEEERSLMLNSLISKVQSEEDRKKLVEKLGAEEILKRSDQPLVIRHHDERTLRLRDTSATEGFDPAEVELSMMSLSVVWSLIHSRDQQGSSNSKWMAIKQQLQHFCADDVVSWPEVEQLFHQSVFESMPLTSCDKNGILLNVPGPLRSHTPTVLPWDDPQSFAKQQLIKQQTNGPVFLTADPTGTEQINGKVSIQLDLSDVQSHRHRSLFDWHHTEHHDASVFPQVLQLASDEYCCLDTFRGSHNNILYIFCHNPMSPYHQCKEFWDVALHTDVSFRKYLEHVADAISDWTKEEELKREAMQLSNVSPTQSLHDEEAANSAEVEDEERLEPVIRKESLKAWKMEQLKEDEVEMSKKSKSENPPKGKQQKEEAKSTNKKSTTLPNGEKKQIETEGRSASTPGESTAAAVPPEANSKDVHPTEELGKRFSGYSMDGKLIHVSGHLQHLFPSDGGHITVETIHYVEGSSLMKVTVRKDGHQFHTHINKVTSLPHVKDSNGQKVSEPMVKSVKQGSFTAVLDNGIHLSYSFFGPTGEYTVTPRGVEEVAPETSVLGSVPCERDSPSGFNRLPDSKSKGYDDQLPPAFSSLSLSVPNGLLVQFLREDAQGVSSEEQRVLVKQSFPLHGREAMGQLQDPSLSKELSRIITNQGAVIRTMKDGSTEILFADGSVSCSQDSGPVWVADTEIAEKYTSMETESNKKDESSKKEANAQRGCWLTTTPHGERICTVGTTHELIPTTPLLIFKATDPITREMMITREDLVVTVHNSSGFVIAEHADGTRITSLYQDRPNTPQHMLSAEGGLLERETLNTTSECACGCTECVCVTPCADSVNENVHIDDTCEKGEEISISDERVCNERESSVPKNSEESVFLGENCQKSASTKERVVLVEKEGCATVVMYPERHMAHVFLADATVITGNNQGAYQVFPSSVGLLQIQSDGKCVYSSDPVETPLSRKGDTPSNQPVDYVMSHMDKVACHITDLDGNHFQVMEDGLLSVVNFSPAPSSPKPDEEKPEEETHSETSRLNVKQRAHCPRLFLVHEDGSGTELLSSHTVEELLHQAYSDPAIAVLKEPLPDTRDDFAITILKPSYKNVWSKWLLGKQNPDITPPNLRNRSWHDFPRTERKSPGPTFGTNMGHGLTLIERSRDCASQRQPVRSCPKVLERREVYQHRPFTTQLRNTVDARLKEYIERLMESELRSEEMKVKNPRTEEESAHASDLLNLVLSFAEEEEGGTFSKRHSEDIASLYSRATAVPAEQSDVSEGTATVTSDSFTSGKESKWTERLTQHRQEICAEKACREALKKNYIVPYFHPENIVLYQQTPDMRRLSMDLPPFPKSESAPAFLRDAPTESTPRPLNPTPSQSASHAAGSDRNPERRPTNPTPQTAGEKNLMETSGQYKSVRVDVTGKPRKSKVRLPSSILSSKPCSVPNQQFLSVEEPVRRKCRTISLSNPSVIARGFQLLPSSVDFGTLQEGTSSVITVRMTNVGVDTCRFHVKQPPAATGLRVIYNPGPVAAGLHVELQVQLLAMSAVQSGEMEPKRCISHDVTIHTETDIIYLPVTATILPQRLYDSWLRDHHTSAPSKKGSRVSQVPSNSPSRQVGCKATQHPPNRSFSKKGTP